MSEIIPHLFLSSVVYAKDQYWLNKNQIKNILIIGDLPIYFPSQFSYKCIDIEDKPENNLKQYFEECIDYIDSIIDQNKNILVLLWGLKSISDYYNSIYYKLLRINSLRALNYVKQKHSRAESNSGFLDQLKMFQRDLQIYQLLFFYNLFLIILTSQNLKLIKISYSTQYYQFEILYDSNLIVIIITFFIIDIYRILQIF
ncbi:unnamed protein product [Paramecium sonneborni]|uniref:Tyrosine-protein phosphatase domain-containing protein n=1 Tax=Paramecium sonneborni TaxID=65129 RepID=A0A8S1PCA6_9CILI|nr:unnamed protein product [Paramecium sonneborni]